jgi:hypothetical protein
LDFHIPKLLMNRTTIQDEDIPLFWFIKINSGRSSKKKFTSGSVASKTKSMEKQQKQRGQRDTICFIRTSGKIFCWTRRSHLKKLLKKPNKNWTAIFEKIKYLIFVNFNFKSFLPPFLFIKKNSNYGKTDLSAL